MLSHACGSCGKVLDGSSRSYSHELGMWVARCPRCGFAVRWAPRVAREPARVWARMRALNLRFGVALGSMQLSVLALLFAGSYLDDQLRRGFSGGDLDALLLRFGPAFVGAAIGGILVGVCAATIAPFRRMPGSLALAWTLTIAPLAVISALIVLGEAGPARIWRSTGEIASRLLRHSDATGLVLGAALASSIVASVALRLALRVAIAAAVRAAARARRATFATVRITTARTPFPARTGA